MLVKVNLKSFILPPRLIEVLLVPPDHLFELFDAEILL
jgi:hypothetical protein